MPDPTPAIYAALAAVMAAVDHVAKRDHHDQQRYNFRGVDAVVNAVGPALREHGVIVVPHLQHVDYQQYTTKSGAGMTSCRVVVAYEFHAQDGSQLAATVAAEAFDAGDKATAKAMSVAFRTALLQALALPTDDPDPDAQSYEIAGNQQPQQQPRSGGSQRVSRATKLKPDDPCTQPQQTTIGILCGQLGLTDRNAAIQYVAMVIGREITTRKELTVAEAGQVIDRLNADLEAAPPTEGEPS